MQEINIQQPTDFQELTNKDGQYFTAYVYGASAATSTNYGRFATVRYPIQILRIDEIHETAGTNVGAVTLDVVVVEDGSAISTGTSLLVNEFNLKGTANTLQIKQKRDLSTIVRGINPNQSIALVTTGTLTDVAGVCVTVYYQPYARGSYK
jgi:hypothetical protein